VASDGKMSILTQQYNLVQSSRAVMLGFIENEIGDDITTPVTAFDDKTVVFLLIHVADVYKHWLANFGMKMSLSYADGINVTSIEDVYSLYAEADELTNAFITRYENDVYIPITNNTSTGKIITPTVLELFTHVTTHEFHHKGQIMSMCRLLGHIPPDTDIIRT